MCAGTRVRVASVFSLPPSLAVSAPPPSSFSSTGLDTTASSFSPSSTRQIKPRRARKQHKNHTLVLATVAALVGGRDRGVDGAFIGVGSGVVCGGRRRGGEELGPWRPATPTSLNDDGGSAEICLSTTTSKWRRRGRMATAVASSSPPPRSSCSSSIRPDSATATPSFSSSSSSSSRPSSSPFPSSSTSSCWAWPLILPPLSLPSLPRRLLPLLAAYLPSFLAPSFPFSFSLSSSSFSSSIVAAAAGGGGGGGGGQEREAVSLEYLHRRSGREGGRAGGKTGIDYGCLVGRCGKELGMALVDFRGMHELTCLVTCGPSDLACQMRCGDMYKMDVLQNFHKCAISQHQCVPQRVEEKNKLPDPSLLVPSLSLPSLNGEWFITHGINPIMDCFPCQHHQALVELPPSSPILLHSSSTTKQQQSHQPPSSQQEGGKGVPGSVSSPPPSPRPSIVFDVSYQVSHDQGKEGPFLQTFTRNLQQHFTQDSLYPGLLHARAQGYLQQEDDWYILAADPERYMFVWYEGCNKAWCGFTGGVVFSRTPSLPPSLYPSLEETARKVGVKGGIEGMCKVDNTQCNLK